MAKITVCIPNYERIDILIESFIKIVNDDRISEFIILDDNSYNFDELKEKIDNLNIDKINLFKNDYNLGTFFNKLEVVKKSSNDYCILLDSDNIIDSSYIDVIYNQKWSENKIICPAKLIHHPNNIWGENGIFIDYSIFNKNKINFEFVKKWFNEDKNLLDALLNTGNFFVNKNSYIKAFENNKFDRDIDISDVIYFNYLFLLNNENFLEIGDNLQYIHRVHNGSFYLMNSNLSREKTDYIKNLFKL
jgi:hypothetical protein